MTRWEAESLLCRYERGDAATRRAWCQADREASSFYQDGQASGPQDHDDATTDEDAMSPDA
jgi:hypothetical protein